jgi:hypothetical protein
VGEICDGHRLQRDTAETSERREKNAPSPKSEPPPTSRLNAPKKPPPPPNYVVVLRSIMLVIACRVERFVPNAGLSLKESGHPSFPPSRYINSFC